MQKMRTAAGILLAGLLLWGCGENNADIGDEMEVEAAEALTSELEVQKDGSIVETLVDDFTEEYYIEADLESMVKSEVEEFNRNRGDGLLVSVGKTEQEDGRIIVQIIYPSGEIYSEYNTDDYNKKSLFCGTVAEAFDAGHSLEASLQDAAGEKTIGKAELLEMGDVYLLISENPMRVRIPGKIQYASSNVIVNGKNEALLSGGEETGDKYYIVYK